MSTSVPRSQPHRRCFMDGILITAQFNDYTKIIAGQPTAFLIRRTGWFVRRTAILPVDRIILAVGIITGTHGKRSSQFYSMKKLLLIPILLIVTTTFAQTRVSGTVTDAARRPVPFATVMLLNARDSSLATGTVTDSAGYYYISNVKAGKYLMAASGVAAGKCYSAPFTADSSIPAVTIPVLRLPESTTALKGVEVTVKKPYIEMLADKTVLNVENSVAAAGNNIFEVLRRAPGVRIDHLDNILLIGSAAAIWIDGRPSNMTGETLAQWLKGQPADVVSKIEIIASPGSRFDAAGSGGIINIRLKKNLQQGLNGSVYVSGGAGKYTRSSAGTNMNYRKGKVNVFGNYAFSYAESFNLLNLNSVTAKNGGEPDRLLRENYWHPFTRSHTLKTGADYSLTSKTTLGVIANIGLSNSNDRTDALTTDYSGGRPDPVYLKAISNNDEHNHNYRFNLNLLSTLDTLGSTFGMDADVAGYDMGQEQSILNYLDAGRGEKQIANILNLSPSRVDISSIKADYTKVFSKTWQAEAGAKASFVKTDSDIRYDSLLNNKWERDVLRSDRFRYTEKVQAAYISLSYDVKNWSLKAGVRAERTDAEGYSVTLDSLVRSRYLNFFPSLFIMRRMKHDQQFTLSYAKRIERPAYSLLNPFIRAIDPYTFIVGNPYLQPQFNHIFQLRHSFHSMLFTTLHYSYTQHYSNEVIFSDPAEKVFTTRSENLGEGHYAYLSVMLVVPIGKWLESETNVGAGMARYISRLPEQEFDNQGWGSEMYSNLTFKLMHDWKIQASIDFASPAPSGQARNRMMWGTSFGVQKNIWNKKGMLSLNVSDPFNVRRYDADISTGQSQIHWVNRWESRRVSLRLTCKFGNQQIKAARSRNTGTTEEESRVN